MLCNYRDRLLDTCSLRYNNLHNVYSITCFYFCGIYLISNNLSIVSIFCHSFSSVDFDISNDQIQSVSDCRKFWPKDMKYWNLTLNEKTTERTKTSTTATGKTIATNRPVSSVTGNDTQPSLVTVSDEFDFDTPAAKTYIPVMVCGIIALVAFVAIIILWKKRSDVKT